MYRFRRKRRKRRGYVRPSRAVPKVGWSLRELAALSGFSARSIRDYLQRELLPRSPFRGSATRYDRRQLLWLLALGRLREAERIPLAEARSRLQALSAAELEALATRGLAPGHLADALGLRLPPPPSTRTVLGSAPVPLGHSQGAQLPSWSRIELALGLELHVRNDANRTIVELARRVQVLCGRQGETPA